MKSILVLSLILSCVNSCDVGLKSSEETYTEVVTVLETRFVPGSNSEVSGVAIGGNSSFGGMPALPGAGINPVFGGSRTPEMYITLLRSDSGKVFKINGSEFYGQCLGKTKVLLAYRKLYNSDCSREIGFEPDKIGD